MKTNNSQHKVKEIFDIWRHNRQVYPGWLLLPASEEREILKMRTDDWESHILASLTALTVVERLDVIYELIWRREILLEPISRELESETEAILSSIDCLGRKIEGVDNEGIDWSAVRANWRTVALALLTAARFCLDEDLFNKRAEQLEPFIDDHPDVHHRFRQECCLWAMISMDFEKLECLLDDWTVRDCDPIWMVRKAALLWETDRNDEAAELVKEALTAIRSIPDVEGSVAGASREGWAMWSALSIDNRQELRRRWHELAALKCDAELEKDLIARRLEGKGGEQEAPFFDLGVKRDENFQDSLASLERVASSAVRLSEVAGLPPVTKYAEPVGLAVASDILRSAAEVLATTLPEFAIRLVLRVSDSEGDKTLNRVLSRPRVAVLSDSSVELLCDSCITVIEYAFPRLVTEGRRQRSLHWISKMRVAIEVLSRLVLRVSPERAEALLDMGLQFYQNQEVSREHWLHKSIQNLLQRSWEALPKDSRTARAIELLSMPIVGMDSFLATVPDLFPDPGEFLKNEDLPSIRTPDNDGRLREVIDFLIRGLGGDSESRARAARRIMKVYERGLLADDELKAFTQALWSDKYTTSDSLPTGTNMYDWVFLLLPEPELGMAERCFRQKWLSGDANKFRHSTLRDGDSFEFELGTSPVDPNKVEDVIWNIGAAISKSRHHGQSLELTDDDRKYVAELIEHWATADVTVDPFPFFQYAVREPTRLALRGLASILEEVMILPSVGELLYEKVKKLTDSGTPGFDLIYALIRTIPGRFDELVIWLRMGLASDDESLAASAMSGLRNWLRESLRKEASLQPPSEDLLREVGLMIAVRKTVQLPQALQFATWVFKEGAPGHQQAIGDMVTLGLRLLADDLKYDLESDPKESPNLPLLRFLCVQLAKAMAQSGFEDDPTVDRWLKLSEEDPLPEVRYAGTLPGGNGETGP